MAEPQRIPERRSMADPFPSEEPSPVTAQSQATQPYPIASQRPLDAASRRKLLGMSVGGKSRKGEEIPRTDTHEVLVYRVNGKYRLDNGFGLSHEEVVNATHVVVVDMSRDKRVLVELPIPSSDAEDFHVRVTFTCTVTDPLVIIQEGIDAHSALLSYVKSHHKIVQLGLGYQLAEVNEVRIDVDAEIRALATIRPPALPGLLISLASVEVATPEELAGFHRTVRGLKNTHTLDSLQQGYSQDLDQGHRVYENEMAQAQQQHDLHLDKGRRQHANDVAHAQQDHDHLLGARTQHHDQGLSQQRARFENAMAIAQQQHDHALSVQGQRSAHYLDQEYMLYENAKAITQQEHAQLLATQSHRHDLGIREQTNAFALQELEKAKAVIGTDPQLALQFAFQAGAMSERELVAGLQTHQDRHHDDEQRALEREHAISVFELQWKRETKMQADSDATEEQRFIRGIRAELVRDLIKKGYLDTIDPEALATDLLGELTAGPSVAKPGLPGGDAPAGREDDGPSVREEDGD